MRRTCGAPRRLTRGPSSSSRTTLSTRWCSPTGSWCSRPAGSCRTPPPRGGRCPASAWVAGLLGQNAWRGTADATGLAVEGGGHVTAAEPLPAGTPALALADPAAVALHRAEPTGSPRTVLVGPVEETTALGGRVRVRVASTPPVLAEVTAAAAAELGLAGGGPVWATVKATEVRLVGL